jgi:hypothetical protein
MGKFLIDLIALGRHDRADGPRADLLGFRMRGGPDVLSPI